MNFSILNDDVKFIISNRLASDLKIRAYVCICIYIQCVCVCVCVCVHIHIHVYHMYIYISKVASARTCADHVRVPAARRA